MASRKHYLLIPTIVSRIFDPPVLLVILTIIGVLKSDISRRGFAVLGVLFPLFLGIPVVFLLWLLKTRQIHNIDVTNRKERIRPLIGLLLFLLVDIVIISLFDNPFLLNMFFLYFLWTFGFFIITLFWKISGHTGIATLATGMLMQWFGTYFLVFSLFIPVVAWARIVRKDHTVLQVVAGAVYSLGILAIFSLWVY